MAVLREKKCGCICMYVSVCVCVCVSFIVAGVIMWGRRRWRFIVSYLVLSVGFPWFGHEYSELAVTYLPLFSAAKLFQILFLNHDSRRPVPADLTIELRTLFLLDFCFLSIITLAE